MSTNILQSLLNVLTSDLSGLFNTGITGLLPAVQKLITDILGVFTGQ